MREIKFRAWNKAEKRISPVSSLYSLVLGLFKRADLFNGTKDLGHDLEEVVLMQYTGLKDKNGKEIYEGDIIRILHTNWSSQEFGTEEQQKMTLEEYKVSISKIDQVIFKDAEFTLKNYSIWEGKHGEKEVIGNIYEDKELIK